MLTICDKDGRFVSDDYAACSLAGKRCLIVEDEFLIALDYERILQGAGAQRIFSANTLERAEQLLKQHGPVQIALLDINLNGVSSLPLATRLIQDDVRVIIITGLAGRSALPPGFESVPVLEKPFEEQTLLAAIAAAFARR
jgi:DNA-binding response OmpR family regulator